MTAGKAEEAAFRGTENKNLFPICQEAGSHRRFQSKTDCQSKNLESGCLPRGLSSGGNSQGHTPSDKRPCF